MEEKEIVLRSENISKNFGVTKACKEISLTIKRGEIHGIIGENGSGKSTFCSMLCGIHKISSGKFFLNGEEFCPTSQIDAKNKGVAIIIQEMGTLSGLTVAQNIFLGNEDSFVKFGILNPKAMNREATKILKYFGFDDIKANDMIDTYDFEKRKLVEIAKATYFKPSIVVVDETTTALSQDGRNEIYKQMKDIRSDNRSVIFISHDLQEVLDITDSISVFRDGEYIDTVNSSDVDEAELKRLMVGREIDKKYYRSDYESTYSNEVVVSVKGVSVPKQLNNISFELHKGEILGIGGLSDCGIHEVGKAVFGASFYRSGEVKLSSGKEINSIPDAIANNVAYTSKDRDNESIIVNDSIKDNICLPSLDSLKNKIGIISNKAESEFSEKYAELMSVKMENIEQFVTNLSGGNKQKVVLARWLGKNSNVLILDSPTRGIDIKVKADIYRLMEKLKAEGKSIIMISEEITELLGMCDRILILKNGKINGEFIRSDKLSEEDLIKQMI